MRTTDDDDDDNHNNDKLWIGTVQHKPPFENPKCEYEWNIKFAFLARKMISNDMQLNW